LKKRSATSSSPPEPVFFSDENLGRNIFPGRLREAGVTLEIHADHFQQGAPDTEWLPEVGRRRWVLLTIDARLRYNPLEQKAILAHGVAAFVFTGQAPHDEKAAAFLKARGRIAKLMSRERPPFIAKIHNSGAVEVWLRGARKRGSRRK
jgi:hypothetical protein